MNRENQIKGTTLNFCFLTRVQFEKMHTQVSFGFFAGYGMLVKCNQLLSLLHLINQSCTVHDCLGDICPSDVALRITGLVYLVACDNPSFGLFLLIILNK